MAQRLTSEEKAANTILQAINDKTLSPSYVSMYLANSPFQGLYAELTGIMAEAERIRNREKGLLPRHSDAAETILQVIDGEDLNLAQLGSELAGAPDELYVKLGKVVTAADDEKDLFADGRRLDPWQPFSAKPGETPFYKRCYILADFWHTHRLDGEALWYRKPWITGIFEVLGRELALAAAINNDYGIESDEAEVLINEAWPVFLDKLGCQKDTGFTNLEEVINASALEMLARGKQSRGKAGRSAKATRVTKTAPAVAVKTQTPFLKRCALLTEVWFSHSYMVRGDIREVDEVVWANDLGFSLAFAIHKGLFNFTDEHEALIARTWMAFLEAHELYEDTGFETLQSIHEASDEGITGSWDPDNEPTQTNFLLKWDASKPDLEGGTLFFYGCEILRDFWNDRSDEDDVYAFYAEHYMGLVMARAFADGLCLPSPELVNVVSETWSVFLKHVGCEEPTSFFSYESLKGQFPTWREVIPKPRKK